VLEFDEPSHQGVEEQSRFSDMDEKQINAARQKLFEEGSRFQKTDRNQIAGIDDILDKVDDIAHWLENYQRYTDYGARPEPGVLFEGSPGTGKTMSARYLASLSDALFVNVRDWPYQGSLLSDKDIQQLFIHAREAHQALRKPVILFWDEFENYARHRDEADNHQAALVSQLTAELDGVTGKNEGVLLIGCTNYLHMIDLALRRPGRMGTQITFRNPDQKGRAKLLEHYLKDYPCQGQLDYNALSIYFPDHSAAALEENAMRAWRYSVKKALQGDSEPSISMENLKELFTMNLLGGEPTYQMTDQERFSVSIHEAGHALAAMMVDVPLDLITVRGGAEYQGRVVIPEVHHLTNQIRYKRIRISLAGLAIEEVVNSSHSGGGALDTKLALQGAQSILASSPVGNKTRFVEPDLLSSVRDDLLDASDRQKEFAEDDIHQILEAAYGEVLKKFNQIGKTSLLEIATKVAERVTLTGKEFEEIVKSATKEEIKGALADD
jgi:cell division protease FtsH